MDRLAPGWYPDPSGQPGMERWWSGSQWASNPRPVGHAPKSPRPRNMRHIATLAALLALLIVGALFVTNASTGSQHSSSAADTSSSYQTTPATMPMGPPPNVVGEGLDRASAELISISINQGGGSGFVPAILVDPALPGPAGVVLKEVEGPDPADVTLSVNSTAGTPPTAAEQFVAQVNAADPTLGPYLAGTVSPSSPAGGLVSTGEGECWTLTQESAQTLISQFDANLAKDPQSITHAQLMILLGAAVRWFCPQFHAEVGAAG